MNPADLAEKHIADILSIAIRHSNKHQAVVVYDERSSLSKVLTEAYRRCLPKTKFLNFDAMSAQALLAEFNPLAPSDLVVLIQSTNFRLEAFRIRVELFKRSLKVIEHPHLGRMKGVEEDYYIDALAYDPAYYRRVGPALKERIDRAAGAVLDSGGEKLVFASRFESAMLNIGDYTGMRNIGGQFPIGEVFTEAQDLEAVNGRVRVALFGDTTFAVNKPEKPITLVVGKGRVTDVLDSSPEFDKVLTGILAEEGEIWMREFGFGLNPAFTPERKVSDIGTYERMCGIHLSLGAKHGLYKKPYFRGRVTQHHVDVFAAAESVTLDKEEVYKNQKWIV